MEAAEIYDGLTQILRDVFDDERLVATPTMTAEDVEGWDSLTHIRFALSVERFFKVKFSASEIGKLQNVGEFVDLIRAKLPR